MAKGQITFYLLLGILALIVISFLLQRAQTNPIIAPHEARYDDVLAYYTGCLEESAQFAVDHFATSGNPDSKTSLDYSDYQKAIFFSAKDVPTMRSALASIKRIYLINALDCSMELPFPYDIQNGLPFTNLTYMDGMLIFKTNYPITVGLGNNQRKFSYFTQKVEYPLDRYLERGRKGVNAFLTIPGYINITELNRLDGNYLLGKLPDKRYMLTLYNQSVEGSSYSFVVEVP